MKPKLALKYFRFLLTEHQAVEIKSLLDLESERLEKHGDGNERSRGRKYRGFSTSIKRQIQRQETPADQAQYTGYADPETGPQENHV